MGMEVVHGDGTFDRQFMKYGRCENKLGGNGEVVGCSIGS